MKKGASRMAILRETPRGKLLLEFSNGALRGSFPGRNDLNN